jgi:hypothetical protein
MAHDVFTNAFVIAMRPTLALPIAVLVVVALSCFAVRAHSVTQLDTSVVEEPASVA